MVPFIVKDLEQPLPDDAAADEPDAMFHVRLSCRPFLEGS
jgi:hypothetical protein